MPVGLGVGIVVGGALRSIAIDEAPPTQRGAAQGLINICTSIGTLAVGGSGECGGRLRRRRCAWLRHRLPRRGRADAGDASGHAAAACAQRRGAATGARTCTRMNLAHWLQRAARVHPQRAALLRGDRSGGDLRRVGRARGAPGWPPAPRPGAGVGRSCRVVHGQRAGLPGGDARGAVGRAGGGAGQCQAASRRRWRTSSRHSGAPVVLASPRSGRAACSPLGDRMPALREVVVIGRGRLTAALAEATPIGIEPRCAGRPGLAVLHLGHHRPAQGRDADARATCMAMTLATSSTWTTVAPDDAIVYAAPMSHGAGMYIFPHVARGARQVVPASGGFDPAEIFRRSPRSVGNVSPVRRADDGQAAGRAHRGARVPTMRRAQDHRLRRRADVRGRHLRRRSAVIGPRFVQIYGQGESPMTHHRAGTRRSRRCGASAPPRAAGLGRHGAEPVSRSGRRRRRQAAAARRAGRGAGPRRRA